MSARIAWLAIGFVLILFADHPAAAASHADSRAAHAAEARALRAQIDRMDQDLQTLETRLHAYTHGRAGAASHQAEAKALRAQIHQMDRDQELLEDRLHELEKSDPAIEAEHLRHPTPAEVAAPASVPAPVAAAPAPAPAPAPLPAPAYTARGPALRQAADPAPYEAATDSRIAMFRLAFSLYRWIPVGSNQLVVFNTYDQAYLLDFASACPGLLSASRIEIQNFSTRVKMGEHAVIADGQHCLITNIRELRISKLPKALRP